MAYVAYCVPSGDTWKADTAVFFGSICAYSASKGLETCIMNHRLCSVAHSRNLHVIDALKVEPRVTHLMWVDSDQTFPSRSLVQLLGHDKDMVGAFYPQKASPYHTVGRPTDIAEIREGKALIRADILGGGFVLVKRKVYERLRYPWYEERYSYEPEGFTNEDVTFSYKCRTAEIEMWADLDLSQEMGHSGNHLVRFDQAATHKT